MGLMRGDGVGTTRRIFRPSPRFFWVFALEWAVSESRADETSGRWAGTKRLVNLKREEMSVHCGGKGKAAATARRCGRSCDVPCNQAFVSLLPVTDMYTCCTGADWQLRFETQIDSARLPELGKGRDCRLQNMSNKKFHQTAIYLVQSKFTHLTVKISSTKHQVTTTPP